MKRQTIFSLIFVGIYSVTVAQTSTTENTTAPKWARSRTIDVKHLSIDLQFDWKKKQALIRQRWSCHHSTPRANSRWMQDI